MEFVLLGLLALAIPICAIAGFVMALDGRRAVRRLDGQVRVLEGQVRALRAQLAASPGAAALPEPPSPDTAPAEAPADAAAEPLPGPAPRPASVPPVAAPPAVAPARPGLEERLGTRWAVWVGGVALALGGLFLVRYSIEQGLLGPAARVAAGALFALALIGAGEALRRRERGPVLGSAHVPGVLTAAGTSTAFATAYAAHGLYGMVGPGLAVVLLGLIAVLTIAAAALHGPALGALGLLAALASPLLVESAAPQAWPLVLYLAVAVTAAYAVARLRLWRWLGLAACAGAVLWTLLLMLTGAGGLAPLMAHVLIQLTLAGLFLVADPHRRTADAEARPDAFAGGALLAFALVSVLVAAEPGLAAARPVFAGAAGLILFGLAFRFPSAAPGAALAALVAAGTLALWPVVSEMAQALTATLPGPLGEPRPEALATYLLFATASAAGLGSAGLWRIVRGRDLPLSLVAWFAGAATAGPLAILVVAYWRVAQLDRSLSFALAAGLLGAAFAAAAGHLRRHERETDRGLRLALGASAAGGVAALALGLTFALDRGMLTVAFALAALGTAWVAHRADVPALRYAAGALGALVLGRLAWDPTIVGGDPGRWPVLNWLLVGYGVPALSFLGTSRLMERGGRDLPVRLTEALAIIFSALLVLFQIRHALQGGDPLAPVTDHLEVGLIAATSLLFAFAMVRIDVRRPDGVTRVASIGFAAAAVLIGFVGLGVAVNPLLSAERVVGGAILNSLILAYLAPAALAFGLAWVARGVRPRWYRRLALGLGFVLHGIYTIAAIRRVFQGPMIGFWRTTGEGELWTYSAALVLTGVALLAIGLLRDLRIARIASAAYIVAAVAKVFLVDLANLEGVMQALSFIGLGLALVGIGLAYQRLLVRPSPQGG